MAERLSNSGAEFSLHYCARSRERAAFIDRIRRSAFAGRVRFHFSDRGERLDITALLAQCEPETHLYVCGPNRFMDAVIEAAQTQGWTEERVHCEYFVAAARDSAQDSAFDVRIASSGRVIHVPKDRTVVSVLAEHGIDIPVSCCQGVCGTCLTRVIEGEVAHHDMILSAEERAKNVQFTPCCSRSVGPMLVLDL
jgi:vanillate O-demethylase ferredoxin subunit